MKTLNLIALFEIRAKSYNHTPIKLLLVYNFSITR